MPSPQRNALLAISIHVLLGVCCAAKKLLCPAGKACGRSHTHGDGAGGRRKQLPVSAAWQSAAGLGSPRCDRSGPQDVRSYSGSNEGAKYCAWRWLWQRQHPQQYATAKRCWSSRHSTIGVLLLAQVVLELPPWHDALLEHMSGGSDSISSPRPLRIALAGQCTSVL
jgi:hypothetical protein